MLISAIQKFTLLDYPNHTACIVFTPGCNFRCGYCHNKEFILPELIQKIKPHFIPEKTFWHFLDQRKNLLEGVVVSGGEPTMMGDLVPFLEKIKKQNFLVKLDTNGNNPEVIKKLFTKKLVDSIAMDVKTSLREYKKLVGPKASEVKLSQSLKLIQNSGVDYEFRSTLIKEIHTPEIIKAMIQLLEGAQKLFLQTFRPQETLNPVFAQFHPFSPEEMKSLQEQFQSSVEQVYLR